MQIKSALSNSFPVIRLAALGVAALATVLPSPVSARDADQSEKQGHVITLEQAYDMTLATDQSIRIAFFEIQKAKLQPWRALTRMGPQLTAGADYGGSGASKTTQPGVNNFVTAQSDTYSRTSTITFDQPLFDPTVFPAYRLGKLTSQSAHLQYQFTVRQTLFGVAQAYYNVLKQQSVVSINQQTVDLAQEQLKLAQTRFDVGAVARIDVMRAKATLEDARNTLIQSKGLLSTNLDTLSNILNLGGKTDFTVAEPPNAPDEAVEFDFVLSRAYAGREDYKVSAIAIDQDIATRDVTVAGYAPSLSVEAITDWNRSAGSGFNQNEGTSATIKVSMPFLTGGQREIDIRTQNHIISQTRLKYENTKKSIEAEVKGAWIKVGTARQSIQALRAEVDAATQNYTDLQAQYEAGTATSLDVQSALRDLNNSRTLLTSQVYDYQVALRDLQRSEAVFEKGRVEKAKVK